YHNTNVRGGNYFAYLNLLLGLWLTAETLKQLYPDGGDSWRRSLTLFGWTPLAITGFICAYNNRDLLRERRFLWGAAWILALASGGFFVYDYFWRPVVSPFKIESPFRHVLTGGASFFGIVGLILLTLQWMRESGMNRKQTGALLAAGSFLFLGMITQYLAPQKWAAYEIHLGGVILYSFALIWGHFRYGLFGLLPVSREALLEGLNEGVVVFNADGWIIDVNSTAFKYLGSRQSLLGRKADDIVVRELGLSPEVIHRPEFRTEVRAGEGRWLYVHIAPVEPSALPAYHADPGFDVIRTGMSVFGAQPKPSTPPVRILTIFDITSVKETMEALHRSDQRLSLYVRRTPLPYIEWDLEGKITEWNAAAENVFGFSKTEALGKPVSSILNLESNQWPMRETPTEPRHNGRTLAVKNKSGGTVYGDFYVAALFDAEGRPIGTAAMVIDLSAERQARHELRQKTAELESVFSALPDIFLRIRYDGTLTDFRAGRNLSPGWRRLLNELKGRPALSPERLPEPLRGVLFEYWPQIRKIMRELEVLHAPQSLQVECEHAGESYVFEVRFVAADAQECIAVVRNISEEWKARRALANSERQYRAVVEDQSEYICRYTPDLSLTFVNEAFCKRYAQCEKEQLLGVSVEALLPAAAREAFHRQIAGITPERPMCEDVYATPTDRGLRWIQWKHRGIFDAEGRPVEYQSIGQDVTERKLAQDELEQKNRALAVYGAVFERLHALHKGQSSAALGEEQNLKMLLSAYMRTVCEPLGFDGGVVGYWNAPKFEVFAYYGRGKEWRVSRPQWFEHPKFGRIDDGPFEGLHTCVAAPAPGEPRMFLFMGSFSPCDEHLSAYHAEMAAMTSDSIASLTALHRLERRRATAEAALKQSELRFRTLATQTPDLILIYAQELGKPLFANRESFMGYRVEDGDFLPVLGQGAVDQTAWNRFFERAAACAEAYEEMIVVNAEGDEEWVQARSHALHGSERHVIFIFSVVTAFKRQQEALWLRTSALDQISTPVFAFNLKGQITYWNRPAEELTLWKANEAIGRPIHELLLFKAEIPKIHEAIEAANKFERWDGEMTVRRKDDAPRTMLFNLSLIRNTDKTPGGYVGILMDVSERKKAEIALREAKEAAEAATRAKSDFLATVSHEIRTPMNGVIGMTHLLRQTPLTPDQADLVETIRISGERLLALLNDILDFSKIESGKMELEARDFLLKKAVQSAVELFSAEAARKQLYLKTIYDESLPKIVVGDDARLQQVIINLVSNALKFTEKGGVTVKVCGRVENERVELEFSVEDTGVGVPKEKQ
ncbi:MAG: PAS domain S-box protein, partial [Bacteroidia bacterium]|nr:PAS domain S-box protein [Bacteroidia bacterium]